jgi:hypothetical protein
MGAQLDPANNKSILDIQSDKLASTSKVNTKASTPNDSYGDAPSTEPDVHMQDPESHSEEDTAPVVPLSRPESIETLRAKLHAKIDAIRSKKGGGGEGCSKDELLEERRLQRAAMRERRRKETKAKIKKEREDRGKSKEKTAPPVKVSGTR